MLGIGIPRWKSYVVFPCELNLFHETLPDTADEHRVLIIDSAAQNSLRMKVLDQVHAPPVPGLT